MAEICQDDGWDGPNEQIKTLTLEHHMAASRRGFAPLFAALDSDKRLSTGLRQGDLAGIRFFSERVMPLVASLQANENFAVMSHLRANSPLLKAKALAKCNDLTDPLSVPRRAVEELMRLNFGTEDVTFQDVLRCVAKHKLFEIPSSLAPFIDDGGIGVDSIASEPLNDGTDNASDEEDSSDVASLAAWRAFIKLPYAQIFPFVEYISDQSPYGTHQGVKGLEFDRVLVIMDDSEAKGFMFSYGKLFGTTPSSGIDLKRSAAGEETGVDRTRRLLYVTATRARKSLALIGYTEDLDVLAKLVVQKGWFTPEEVEIIS
jgi:DNA helicase-2/ATP-dependent DNA helicase PcrA